jgi:hypothetical protein
MSVIDRLGGVSTLYPSKTPHLWNVVSLELPPVFPATECWIGKPSYDDLLNDLLHAFN